MNGRVLVTGATGFVGTALLPELARAGYQPVALVRSTLDRALKDVDIRRTEPIETLAIADWRALLTDVDAVVHLAGIAHTHGVAAADYARVNTEATANLAQAAAARGVPLVFLSSIRAQCGPSAAMVQSDASPPAPTDDYGRSKLAAEHAIRTAGGVFTIFRPVLMVDEGAKGHLASLVRLARWPVPLPVPNRGGLRSLISRADVVQLIGAALKDRAFASQTFVLADPEPLSIGEMLAHIRRGMGRKAGFVRLPDAVLRPLAALLGGRAAAERLFADLTARPDGLLARGWRPLVPARAALERLGSAARA